MLSNRVEPKKRECLHPEAEHEVGLQKPSGRKNNANEEKPDQASAERAFNYDEFKTVVSNYDW